MSRIGTWENVDYRELRPNPDWSAERIEKARRGEIKPACHDGSPHADLTCECGYGMHLHLSQIESAPSGAEIAARCHRCGRAIVMDRDQTVRALREAWGQGHPEREEAGG